MTEKLIFNCTYGKDHAERARPISTAGSWLMAAMTGSAERAPSRAASVRTTSPTAPRSSVPLGSSRRSSTGLERWPSPERGRQRDTSDQPAPGSPSSPLLGRRLPIQVCALSELCAGTEAVARVTHAR